MVETIQVAFEELARGFYLEGLLVDGDDVWFTDVALGGVRNLADARVLLPERRMIGGLLRNADGRLLVPGEGGVAWVDPSDGAHGMLVELPGGVNEMRSDGAGGMVFGTIDLPAILRGAQPGPSTIQRLTRDGRLIELYGSLAFANGLSLSADGNWLFFNESFAAVRAFPVGPDLALGAPRTLAERPDCDGMALDAEGNVWISGFSSPFLSCLAPDGRELCRIALPGGACTNVRFGGPDMRDLYVTIVSTRAARRLATGEPLVELSSTLCRGRSPVPGAPLARTDFRLG